MKDSFVLFKSHNEYVQELSLEQRGLLLTAIFEWQVSGELPVIDDLGVKLVFKMMSTSIEAANQKYDEVCGRRREAGKLGGRPKKANGFEEKPKKANGFFAFENEPKKANGFFAFENEPKKANGFFAFENETKEKQTKANESNEKHLDIDIDIDIKEKDIPNGISKKKRKYKNGLDDPDKVHYAEFVALSEEEYGKLKAEFGNSGVNELITILNDYKGSAGKVYASDYYAIRNWVVDRYNERGGKENGHKGNGAAMGKGKSEFENLVNLI